MGETGSATGDRWPSRPVAPALVERYRAEGWWDDAALGDTVARGLGRMGAATFTVRSSVRPWRGTFAQVDRAARALAAALHDDGVGPGDVVVLQLPNWVEAGIAFWAAAYLGAVVVPVVHFYGPREVAFILRTVRPSVVVTADRFGHSDYLSIYGELLAALPEARWLVAGEASATRPRGAADLGSLLDGEPLTGPLPVDPDLPAIIAFTSGTTSDPKGVLHSHRTIGSEMRQLDHLFPRGGPEQITGAPVGHFIGMLNAFLVPLLRRRAVHLVDVWDPKLVLQTMRDEGLGMGGGSTFFLTSLLDHPDCSPDHLALMPFAGLGGSPVPAAVTRRATDLGIDVFRSYGSTEHPSITGSLLSDPREKRLTTDGRALPGVELRLDPEGQILSRGPDCCVGYIDQGLTDAVFDADGWYHTGDVGVLDDDGYLTITDRISDIIIRGGENISAAEIEEVLAGMAGVLEVCVVAEPDARFGERAAAVLRAPAGAAAPTLEGLRAHLGAAGLARQKWPEAVYAVDELPRTASGKVQKVVLRRQLREGRLAARTEQPPRAEEEDHDGTPR